MLSIVHSSSGVFLFICLHLLGLSTATYSSEWVRHFHYQILHLVPMSRQFPRCSQPYREDADAEFCNAWTHRDFNVSRITQTTRSYVSLLRLFVLQYNYCEFVMQPYPLPNTLTVEEAREQFEERKQILWDYLLDETEVTTESTIYFAERGLDIDYNRTLHFYVLCLPYDKNPDFLIGKTSTAALFLLTECSDSCSQCS